MPVNDIGADLGLQGNRWANAWIKNVKLYPDGGGY
jgi:hypothetical protein